MNLSTSTLITNAADGINAHLGGNGGIPIITFGDPYSSSYHDIHLTRLLTPSEQVTWLLRLAAEATRLAAEVEALAVTGEQVSA